jgi:hypothetical protein
VKARVFEALADEVAAKAEGLRRLSPADTTNSIAVTLFSIDAAIAALREGANVLKSSTFNPRKPKTSKKSAS